MLMWWSESRNGIRDMNKPHIYALASYGQTKLECSQTAATADAIGNALTRGTLPIWGSEVKP